MLTIARKKSLRKTRLSTAKKFTVASAFMDDRCFEKMPNSARNSLTVLLAIADRAVTHSMRGPAQLGIGDRTVATAFSLKIVPATFR